MDRLVAAVVAALLLSGCLGGAADRPAGESHDAPALSPRTLEVTNADAANHTVAVAVSDADGQTVWNATFALGPGEDVRRNVTDRPGRYTVSVAVDGEQRTDHSWEIGEGYHGIRVQYDGAEIHVAQAVE